MIRALYFSLLALLLSWPLTARTQGLAYPTGEVLLSVSGAIEQKNAPEAALFDLEMLQTFEAEEISTTTIWTEGTQKFVGVPLTSLLRAVGAHGMTISAQAINDYAVEIKLDNPLVDSALVAYLRNGATMSIREKGPLWIVFPYDSDPAFQSEIIYSQSIWQLDRLHVEN